MPKAEVDMHGRFSGVLKVVARMDRQPQGRHWAAYCTNCGQLCRRLGSQLRRQPQRCAACSARTRPRVADRAPEPTQAMVRWFLYACDRTVHLRRRGGKDDED